MNRKYIYILLLAVLIITFISYIPAFKGELTNWDDNVLVTENVRIRDLTPSNIKSYFITSHARMYHPLVLLSYAVDYKIGKLDPSVYHVTNILIHLINCALVFWIIFLLSKEAFIAFFVAVLFGIHPLHVESVAWVAERKDVLYAVFYLGAMIAYIYFKEKKNWGLYGLSVILFLLSLFSKAMAVSLPLVLLLVDYYYDQKIRLKDITEKIPFFILSAIFAVIAMNMRPSFVHENIPQYPFYDNIFLASYGFVFYIIKTFLPIDLSVFYPFPKKIDGFLPAVYLVAPLIAGGFIAFLWVIRKKLKKIFWGGTFFLLTVLPVLRITGSGPIVADRYTYVPIIGIFLIIAVLLMKLMSVKGKNIKNSKYAVYFAVGMIVLIMSILTIRQCSVWKDSISIWTDFLNKYSDTGVAADAFNYRGEARFFKKDFNGALSDFDEAVKRAPTFMKPYNGRGIIYCMKGDYDKALLNLNKAIEINPNYEAAYNNRGNLYLAVGKPEKAIDDYTVALSIKPYNADAYYNRGLAYRKTGEEEKAKADIARAESLRRGVKNTFSKYHEVWEKKGMFYYKEGKLKEALDCFNKAVELSPNYAQAYNNRGVVYARLKDLDLALADYSRAIQINPQYAQAYYNRAFVYMLKKQFKEAADDINIIRSLGFKIDPRLINEVEKGLKSQGYSDE